MREAEMRLRITLGMGILVVLVTSGCGSAGGQPSSGAVSAPPSVSPTSVASTPGVTTSASVGPSASAAFDCDEETTGCAGPLTAGEHRTAQFERPFTFT